MTDEELTIDQLAAASHVPSRTIRFYQSRGALMNPEIRGRVAYYGKQHVERLKLIAQLQDRGLRIDAIGDLMKRIDRGEVDLAEWLGVEEQVQAPWALDQARTVTEAELSKSTHGGIATVNALLDGVLGIIDTVRSYEPTSRSAKPPLSS